ncbi:MAG TPA: FAD-binding oxidoreductase [Nannocystaceae bacterium]|nr:FAD-binding oxidoreductase [Nannocystaceae bacterium]
MSRAEQLGARDVPLPERCDVAIVGGGVMGLSTAYHLADIDEKLRIVVLERGYLVSGASGRNGGGVRMQWGDEGNVQIMMESIEICRGLAQELGINLWFRQGGYLFLARGEAGEQRLRRNAELHRRLGAPTRLLGPDEAKELVPELDTSQVRLAAFNPQDGVVFPWPFVWGYAAQAIARGVVVRTHTAAERAEPSGDGLLLHLSTGERLHAQRVVNATGAWCHGLNHSLGVTLPNRPHRHEILSTEPLKPFLDPLVVDLESGLYFSQSTRGEIVAGITLPDHAPPVLEVDQRSSLRFLAHLGAALTRLMPLTGAVKVLRQWAGPYDVSPDGDAIVGPSLGQPALLQLCGFTGHGFMMAPAVGRMLARFIAKGERHAMLERWDPTRFARGDAHVREDMIIG